MFDTALELYNKLLNIYKTQYDKPTKAKKKRIKIDLYLDEDNLPPITALEGDEEVKLDPEETIAEIIQLKKKKKNTGTGLETFTPNKLLTRLPILLAQIKAGKNSYKLKNEIRQMLYLLYQGNKITKKVYNNLIKSL